MLTNLFYIPIYATTGLLLTFKSRSYRKGFMLKVHEPFSF